MGMYWRVGFSDFIYDEIFQERGLTCLTSWHCEMEPWESNFTRRSSTRKSPFKLVNNGLYNVYIVLFGVELSFLAHNFLQATTKRIWALMATQPPVGGAAPTNRAVGSVCMWRRPSTQGTTYETSGKHGSSLGATRKRWNMVKHGETWWNFGKDENDEMGFENWSIQSHQLGGFEGHILTPAPRHHVKFHWASLWWPWIRCSLKVGWRMLNSDAQLTIIN